MDAIKDITLSSQLQGLRGPGSSSSTNRLGGEFADMIKKSIESVNTKQVDADKAAVGLASGQHSNIHEVMIKMEEAEISLRLMVQMRNKVVEAYQEIMRMQV
jgi:flagellar hook-basal body complex protein FliE